MIAIQPHQLFITLVVILFLLVGFWIFHVVLPERAENRRLKRKLDALPKASKMSLVADSMLSGEFEERRLRRADNDSGIHADWVIHSELDYSEG